MNQQVKQLLDKIATFSDPMDALSPLTTGLIRLQDDPGAYEEALKATMEQEPYREKIFCDMTLGGILLQVALPVRDQIPSYGAFREAFKAEMTKQHGSEFTRGLLEGIPSS